MDKIKFRGKSIKGNKWVIGDLVDGNLIQPKWVIGDLVDGNLIQPTGNFPINHSFCFEIYLEEVIFETVGQYVGKRDKDGKEIFKDDIVEIKGIPYLVYWENDSSQWRLAPCGDKQIDKTSNLFFIARVQKIGNIHDNPELLKRKTG